MKNHFEDMIINNEQLFALQSVFISSGLKLDDFKEMCSDSEYCICHKKEPSIRFLICRSIQGARVGDVFCKPYTYQESMYKGCDVFDDCLKLARDWSAVSKYQLFGKPYYHKVFISHASVDKPIVDEFVDRVLRLACGFKTDDIVYTSREDTGVEYGEGIPDFIKENLHTSSLVLFMISDNYKKSEVCLNEMGAAWALEKKTVSIVLPNCGFESLGWLTSLDKALKIDSSESLDKLYGMLTRTEQNAIDWNRQKEAFLAVCESYTKDAGGQKKSHETKHVDNDKVLSQNLRLFDEHFYLRSITEGVFHFQIDVRMRALENITLRKAYLKNANEFVGTVMDMKKVQNLFSFVPMGIIEMRKTSVEEVIRFFREDYNQKSVRVQDYHLMKDVQQSVSFIGDIITIRECDGYVDLPLNHWSLCVEYDMDGFVSIPLGSNVIEDSNMGYFWRN